MSKDEIKLKWQQAPVKTQWGDEMVVASVAIDKDHTVCLYCEREQTPKVDAMFAQRTWVGLTVEKILHLVDTYVGAPSMSYPLDSSDWINFARAIEAAHGIKEKNTL